MKDLLETLGDDLEARYPEYREQRPKEEAVLRLIGLRRSLGLSQKDAALRANVPPARINEIESKPWNVTWERIHAYASALGADFRLILPGEDAVDAVAVESKLRELTDLLRPLTSPS